MVGSSILPVTFHNNKLLFLFGKETTMDDSQGWSDFGGGMEPNETSPLETAIRECSEELTGFLGDPATIKAHIKKHYHIHHQLGDKNSYHVHIIHIPYDENLPKYYNNNHEFLWNRMDRELLKKTKLFEKINIKWFSIPEIKQRKHEFRKFYQEIVDHILQDVPKIQRFFIPRRQRTQKAYGKTLKKKD